jgi:catalase
LRANNAFVFINSKRQKQVGRYQIVPVDGTQYLDDATAKAKSPGFLSEELKPRLAKASGRFRLLVQLAETGDQTNDGSVVWADDRKNHPGLRNDPQET